MDPNFNPEDPFVTYEPYAEYDPAEELIAAIAQMKLLAALMGESEQEEGEQCSID